MTKRLIAAAAIAVAILARSSTADAQRWVFCGREHGFCSAPYGAIIHYGLNGVFAYRRSPPGGPPCDNAIRRSAARRPQAVLLFLLSGGVKRRVLLRQPAV
jgi:hypothetical protein